MTRSFAMRHAERSPLALLLLLSTLSPLAGCSAIPPGASPPERIPEAPSEPLPLSIAVGAVEVELAGEEKPKEYRPEEVLDPEQARADLAAWAAAAGALKSVRAARGTNVEAQLDDAWEQREDLFLSLRLDRFRSEFVGHNGWWVPNIINWVMFMIPAWWVATEEYSLAFTAELTIRSVDSSRVLHQANIPVEVQGTFDEFDRGWQFFGFIYPNNDADNWRQIVERLLPAARAELGAQLARELAGPFRERMAREQAREQMQKTLALLVGISHYQDAVALPPLPYAVGDARALVDALTDPRAGSGLVRRQVKVVSGSDATRERVLAGLAELGARAQPGDQVLVYFAGYGTRAADGSPLLLLNDQGDDARLSLEELGARLAEIKGEKLVLLDCGFDGQARSVQSQAPRPEDPQADVQRLVAGAGGAALLATRPGSHLHTPEHLGAGLFSWHLVQGLRGAADLDESGTITAEELFAFTRRSTLAESAYFGAPQEPVAAGLGEPRFGLAAPQPAAAGGAPE